ncbi:hypothetical protein VTN31DRAFT_166 [Thermomyces dupontii]|uniref:uncharacterized protein n=1 Tax=Talaromyces thermophilus TaxID=28565 RepID=UPI0037432D4D
MTLRDRFRRAFHRSSNGKDRNNKPKVQYYRDGECPRSKYRGPVDPEHRRKLYEWNFADATAHSPRSIGYELSPCTSRPHPPPQNGSDMEDEASDQEDPVPEVTRRLDAITVTHREFADDGNLSQSSTVVGSLESQSTLTETQEWAPIKTTPAAATVSPKCHRCTGNEKTARLTVSPTQSRRRPKSDLNKALPIPPDELARALNAIQYVS